MAVGGAGQKQIVDLLKSRAPDEESLRNLSTKDLKELAKSVSPNSPDAALEQIRQVRDALLWKSSETTEATGLLTARLRKTAESRKPKFQASSRAMPLGPWSLTPPKDSNRQVIALDGDSLNLDQLHELIEKPPVGMNPEEAKAHMAAVKKARAEGTEEPPGIVISPKGQNNIHRSNELLLDGRANPDEPIYGIDTGFGAQKDSEIQKEHESQIREFQLRQLLSHNIALGDELPDPVVRTAMLLRVNAMSSGHLAGNSLELAQRYTDVMNVGLTPVVRRVGGLGMGDLPTNTAIGLAAIGHPAAELKRPDGTIGPADQVLKEFGIEPAPMTLAPGEGLAVMSGTSTIAAGLVYAEQKIQAMVEKLEATGHAAGAEQLKEALNDARAYMGVMLKKEINAASGSPLAFENADGKLEVKSGGNWSEAMLGVSIDHLSAVLTASMHTIANTEDQKDLLEDMRENAAQSAATALGQSTQGGQEDAPTMAFGSLNNLLDQMSIADQIIAETTPSKDAGKKFPLKKEHADRSDAVRERFGRLSRLLDGASALYFEADFALADSFDPKTHESRGVPGQIVSAQNINKLREGSQFVDDQKQRVQDAVVHRATPDIHGAAHTTTAYLAGRDRKSDSFLLSGALDQVGRVATQAAVASERRTARLIAGQWSHGLPTYLSGIEGAETGVAQISSAATAHLMEMRQATGSTLAQRGAPKTQRQADRLIEKSLDKAESQLARAEVVIAAEVMSALQGIDIRVKNGEAKLEDLGAGTKALYELVRGPEASRNRPVAEQQADGYVPFIEEDRDVQVDLQNVINLVRDGRLDTVLRQLDNER